MSTPRLRRYSERWMKRPIIDQELNMLFRYGLDKFRTMREKVLPEYMTEFLPLEEDEENYSDD
jgi:hypothetical protein